MAYCTMHYSLLLRKNLNMERYIPVQPVTERLHEVLETSENEVYLPVIYIMLEKHRKLGKSIFKPGDVAHTDKFARIYNNPDYKGKPVKDMILCTFAGAGHNDILFAFEGYQAAVVQMIRWHLTEKPILECRNEKWKVLSPGFLE
jgi:hypothetical protein